VVLMLATLAAVDATRLPAGYVGRWSYTPSALSWEARVERFRARLRRGAFPDHAPVVPIRKAHERWIILFLYVPGGVLSGSQRLSLQRLKDLGLALLIVCAAPDAKGVPQELHAYADALIWKGLRGYDMSGYTVALHHLATHSPGATALVMNDSVFGPINDLRPLIDAAPWELTGLTAHHGDENHLQTYAFVLKGITPERVQALSEVFTTRWSLGWGDHVVAAQEVPLSRVAARSMSVGAYLYAASGPGDPMVHQPFELIELGHPFLKKSLLGKMHAHQDTERVVAFVVDHGLMGRRA
jgi:hypothetical protein